MKTLKCSSCGGNLQVFSLGNFAVCPFCQTKNVIEYVEPSWKGTDYENSRTCPACREESLVLNVKGTSWKCLNCGYSITDEQLEEEIYWFCDSCDAFMNVQPGFRENKTGRWKCMQCGFENDVTEENIFD